MTNVSLSSEELLALLPQRPPFRFVDRVMHVDGSSICAAYRFREDEAFYGGHFPDGPVTPGVILLECMAQCGVALHGLYLSALATGRDGAAAASALTTLLTDADIEWLNRVYPGETVIVTGQLRAWRRQRIRSQVEMRKETGEVVARGEIGGIGVRT
jgi:3-hydroxyacyl-[acyl-carrier-protein] dehydratase